jgi:hypothetical protein
LRHQNDFIYHYDSIDKLIAAVDQQVHAKVQDDFFSRWTAALASTIPRQLAGTVAANARYHTAATQGHAKCLCAFLKP